MTRPISLAALRVLELTPPEMVSCAAEAGQDAEALVGRQLPEAEQRRVEGAPVSAALGADVPHDAEPVQAGDRRHLELDGRDRHEIDVADRELAPAVDEMDAAGAGPVHARDAQLHRLQLDRYRPGAELDHPLPRRAGIAHAQRNGCNLRRFGIAEHEPWPLTTMFLPPWRYSSTSRERWRATGGKPID